MSKVLAHDFFDRPADHVARDLIGRNLCIRHPLMNTIERLMITETEAYMGPHDHACHSSKGRTPRTEVMYKEAGTIYIYLIYGIYTMLNIVTGEVGYPAAVLIRGAGEYDGPGKLTRALGIGRGKNGLPQGKAAGIWIEEDRTESIEIRTTPRIGIGEREEWKDALLRFVATGGKARE